MFYKIDVLKNSPKVNKVADLRPATLLKMRLRHTSFPVNFAKFLRMTFHRAPPYGCLVSVTMILQIDSRNNKQVIEFINEY